MGIWKQKEWKAENDKREQEQARKQQIQDKVDSGELRKGWFVPNHGWLDFSEPVSFEDAKNTAEIFREIWSSQPQKQEQ